MLHKLSYTRQWSVKRVGPDMSCEKKVLRRCLKTDSDGAEVM